MTGQTQYGSGEGSMPPEERLVYEPNPKHKEPWQRGARGSLCPRDADGPALLTATQVDPKHPGKRYATDGHRAYCGQEHHPDDGMGIRSNGGRSRPLSAPVWRRSTRSASGT